MKALIKIAAAALAITALTPFTHAHAEGTIRISEQFGTLYLPIHVIRDQNLLEKHAEELGLENLEVEWLRISGGNAINDALLSGSLDIAAAGIGPFFTLWDRTDGGVKLIGGLANQPNYLITNNPEIETLADFTSSDRIALPAVGISVQARILQMAAEQEFGEGEHGRLDDITITLPHPDATAALLSGATEINAHLSNTPFQERALQDENIHTVFSSYDVLGEAVTPTYVYTTTEFRENNPLTFQVFFEAFREASEWIEANYEEAAETYVRVEESSLDPEFVQSLLEAPESRYTLAPSGSFKFADFLFRTGAISRQAESWRDYSFEELQELHADDGS